MAHMVAARVQVLGMEVMVVTLEVPISRIIHREADTIAPHEAAEEEFGDPFFVYVKPCKLKLHILS